MDYYLFYHDLETKHDIPNEAVEKPTDEIGILQTRQGAR